MSYFSPEKFQQVIYFSGVAGTGNLSGSDASNAKGIAADTNVWPIPAKCLIERCYIVIDTAITGTTNLDFGDDDDADGFVDGSLSVTLGTAGMYGWDAKKAGAYLRVETAGATDPADIYVVPAAKYYASSGKKIKCAISTTNTAGAFKLVVEGSMLG